MKIALCLFVILELFFVAGCNQSSSSSPAPAVNDNSENDSLTKDDFFPANAKSLLWVGAHPDDEIYIAPLLACLCLKQKLACHLIVITDGGKGHCLLPGGCQPNVATVRAGEMAKTADYFKSTLIMENYEDSPAGSPDGVLSEWNDDLGGGTKVLDAMVARIDSIKPDIVLTFDPRHGSSCHLDHRAVGRLVLAAALKLNMPLSSVYMPQAYWKTGLVSATQPWAGNAVILPSNLNIKILDVAEFWYAFIDNLLIHKSQFSDAKNEYIDAFGYAPTETKILPLLRADMTEFSDSRYQNLCPYNDARWPGQ